MTAPPLTENATPPPVASGADHNSAPTQRSAPTIRKRSSEVELGAHNAEVAGSNPAAFTKPPDIWGSTEIYAVRNKAPGQVLRDMEGNKPMNKQTDTEIIRQKDESALVWVILATYIFAPLIALAVSVWL